MEKSMAKGKNSLSQTEGVRYNELRTTNSRYNADVARSTTNHVTKDAAILAVTRKRFSDDKP